MFPKLIRVWNYDLWHRKNIKEEQHLGQEEESDWCLSQCYWNTLLLILYYSWFIIFVVLVN